MNISQVHKEVRFIAMRSRGPGGQNVNKVSSAVQLTWDFQHSLGLDTAEKTQLWQKLANRINNEGQIYLRCDEFRDLERNKSRGLEKLEALLKQALHRPRPRKATRPTKASKIKRRETKTKRSQVKQTRQKVSWD